MIYIIYPSYNFNIYEKSIYICYDKCLNRKGDYYGNKC